MSNENIAFMEEKKYRYIFGARIKNENNTVKAWILSLEKQDGIFYEYQKTFTTFAF